MLDRERITQHIDDSQLKQVIMKVLDRVEVVLRKHEIKATDFLTPHQIKKTVGILEGIEGISYIETGGYEGAERKLLIIFPEYLVATDVEIPLKALETRGNIQFNRISHRDYLGAILGLGLKREKIGDMLLHQEGNYHFCHIIVHEELKDFILFNFEKVGNVGVSVKEISLNNIKPNVIEYKESSGSVASLRLDAIIGLAFKLSRTDAQGYIARELVTVNWEVIHKNFYEVAEGDMISVRGKGRMEVLSIDGLTRSGRVRIVYRKPI